MVNSVDKPKVLVAGSLCMDYSFYLSEPASSLDENPVLKSERAAGGKGYNQAVAVGRAGAHATLLTALGHDGLGQDLLRIAKQETLLLPYRDALGSTDDRTVGSTDICTVFVQPNGERAIYPTWVASDRIPQGWTTEALNSADTHDFSHVLISFSLASTAVHEVAQLAQANKIPLTVNTAPSALIQREIVAMADTVIGRADELEGLSRRNGQVWIVTRGANGLSVTTDQDHREIKAVPVHSVDSTGAGDCFAGWLTGARAATASLHAGIEAAMIAAALSVTRRGAAKSFPTLADVKSFQERGS